MKLQLTIWLFFIGSIATAQVKVPDLSKEKTLADKVETWRLYCNELMATGEQSDYKLLIQQAKYGISLVPKDSVRKIAMFNLFAGVAYEYTKQFDEAIKHYNITASLAKTIPKTSFEITALSRLETIYDYTNQIGPRKLIMARMIEIADTTKDLNTKELTQNMLSGYYRDRNDYEKAIEYKIQSFETFKQIIKEDTLISANNARLNTGNALSNIGNLFNEVERYDKALQYLSEARDYIGEDAFKSNEESLYVFLTQSFMGLGQIDSAMHYYNASYAKMKGRDTVYSAFTYLNNFFGQYYLGKNNLDSALYFAKEAFRFSKKSTHNDSYIIASDLLGNIYFKQKKYNEAIGLLRVALNNDFEFDKQQYADLHKALAECYAATNRWDSAYSHYNIYSNVKDTLTLAMANKNFADAEARFQNKEKRLLIDEKNLKLNAAQKERWWLIGGLLLAAVSILLLFIIYRNKNRAARLLDEKNTALLQLNEALDASNKTKATLFGIISHDLRTPISQVYNFLRLQQLNSAVLTEEQKEALNKKIQSGTENLLETMEDLLLWSKTQMNEFVPVSEQFLLKDEVENCRALLQLNSDTKNIVYHQQISKEHLLTTDKNFIATIIRNLLQNAIKASPQYGHIAISSNKTAGGHTLIIENTGGNFTQQQYETALSDANAAKLSGLGLQLIAMLAKKINAKINFTSLEENITRVELFISM